MSSSRAAAAAATPMHWALQELGGPSDAMELPGLGEELVAGIDIADVEHRAYERGYQDGQLAGVRAETARVQAALAAIDDALLRLQGEAEAWVGNARENVCAIAVAIARQMVMRELREDPDTVLALAERALAEIPVDQPVVVRVHPDDLAVLESLPAEDDARPSLRSDRSQVQWMADARITRGGCLLEGRDRIIDGRIDTGLERLYRRLTATDA
jgi:flagellar biosynthesis/type III secretory pathway protein FliH